MNGYFDFQTFGDLSGKDCMRYANLVFPFGNLPNETQTTSETELLMSRVDIMNKYVATQTKINDYVEFWKGSMQEIEDELGEYLKKEVPENSIPMFNRTNPSYKLKNDFTEIIELCALRLQDLARLCLQITEQPRDVLQKTNLVVEYEKLLKEWYGSDTEFMQLFNVDHEWIKMIKEMRNEAGWHTGGDRNGRELIFHDVKVDMNTGGKPLLHIPAFEFIGSGGCVRIDNFEEFFDTLMYNIFDLSIDRLVFAYAQKSNTPRPIIQMMIKGRWIEDQ